MIRKLLHIAPLTIVIAVGLTLAACGKKKDALQGAVLTSVEGSVRISDATGKERAIQAGALYTKEALLMPGNTLVTGKDSHADLQFGSGMLMRVGPSTKLKLEGAHVTSDDGFVRVTVDLESGRLFSKSDKLSKGSSLTVATPTAVASVRGTEFMVKEEGGKSETLVKDGSVQVYDDEFKKGGAVEAGKKASVDPKGEVAVAEMTDADKKDVAEMSTVQSITENGRAQMQSILENFEENKARIKETLEEQKRSNEDLINSQREKDKAMVGDQRDKDRMMLEEQRQKDRAELDRIRGAGNAEKDALKDKGRAGMDEIKKQSPSSGQDSAKSELEKIRQQKTK